jgi:hypothetical protein
MRWAQGQNKHQRQNKHKGWANLKEASAMKNKAPNRGTLFMGLLVIAGMLAGQRALATGQAVPVSHAYKDFHDRIEDYEKLHKNAEKSLPHLKKTGKQEVIAARQQALVDKIRELRSNARRGDIFTPGATEAITREIRAVFSGSDGHRVQNTIQAGEPLESFKVEVNQKYPDGLPFTTVPPTLLQKLPRLPDEVDYRILGSTLLLVDRKANLIIDFIPNVIP